MIISEDIFLNIIIYEYARMCPTGKYLIKIGLPSQLQHYNLILLPICYYNMSVYVKVPPFRMTKTVCQAKYYCIKFKILDNKFTV